MKQLANNIFLTALLLLLSHIATAQTFTLQGRVADKDNNPIELASVAVVAQGKMTMTNLKGEYSITLHSADSVVVRYSMIGYRSKTRVLRNPRGKQTLLVQLADDNELGEVVVEGKTPQHGTTKQLDVEDVKQGPSVTGNAVE